MKHLEGSEQVSQPHTHPRQVPQAEVHETTENLSRCLPSVGETTRAGKLYGATASGITGSALGFASVCPWLPPAQLQAWYSTAPQANKHLMCNQRGTHPWPPSGDWPEFPPQGSRYFRCIGGAFYWAVLRPVWGELAGRCGMKARGGLEVGPGSLPCTGSWGWGRGGIRSDSLRTRCHLRRKQTWWPKRH